MPRKAWSDKRERQYEHIKESEEEKGDPRAEEIAARTVNKTRAREGETGGARRGSGGRSTNGPTRDELYERACRRGVKGRSRMTKRELADALQG